LWRGYGTKAVEPVFCYFSSYFYAHFSPYENVLSIIGCRETMNEVTMKRRRPLDGNNRLGTFEVNEGFKDLPSQELLL